MQRPNRFQAQACQHILAEQLGPAIATSVLVAAGVADLPAVLPAGPRSRAQLTAELAAFVRLYHALQRTCNAATALALIRRCIIESGAVSHSEAAQSQASATLAPGQPLNLTSPPVPGFNATPAQLKAGFELAMQFFACDGELLAYTPELVHFSVTHCHWCNAMHDLDAPELIPFFCETDERFMDGHPTHTLVRPSAIGLGDQCCDFRFVPSAGKEPDS